MLYFAYGSNLLKERLAARCPNLVYHGNAYLPDYRLSFDQLSFDGSGKGACLASAGDRLPGVLWELPDCDLPALDIAEGRGKSYERLWVTVQTEQGEAKALTYEPLRVTTGSVPFDWYLALVIAGAMQYQLPEEHIRFIRQTPCKPDPEPSLNGAAKGKAALNQAGFIWVYHDLLSTSTISG